MPSTAQDRARSAKAYAGERKTCPETASGQDLEAARMRVARSSEDMTAMVDGANRRNSRIWGRSRTPGAGAAPCTFPPGSRHQLGAVTEELNREIARRVSSPRHRRVPYRGITTNDTCPAPRTNTT
jgi:hypothetical protein